MHEVGLADTVINNIIKTAQASNAISITEVCVKIGRISGVEPTSFEFAFDTLKEGTMANNAKLIIKEVLAEGVCVICGQISKPERFFSVCKFCSTGTLKITKGKEFEIEYLEVEE